MAFRTLITNEVNNAFNLLQDLAENITFTNVSNVSYDFSTGETSETTGTQATYRAVVTKMNKDPSDNTIITAEVLLKTADVDINDLDNYDTITIRNNSWKINNIEDNGFAVTLTVARKV